MRLDCPSHWKFNVMDLNKQDSCNSRSRQCLEMTNNFPEQFGSSAIKSSQSPNVVDEVGNAQKVESKSILREEDTDIVAKFDIPPNSLPSPISKAPASQQIVSFSNIRPNMASAINVGDQKDIKKEETSLSPISPMVFVPGSGQSNCENDDSFGISSQSKELKVSPMSCEKNNQQQENPTTPSGVSPKSQDALISNTPRNAISFNGSASKFPCSTQSDSQGMLSGNTGCGLGYMIQQQNHVFVFSTQLANKSAEAVLGGQYPSIIAYHCMQPSTKMFLEDFVKCPTKGSVQKQFSMSIMHLMQSGSSGGSFASHQLQRIKDTNKQNQSWEQAAQQECSTLNTVDMLGNEAFDITSVQCAIKCEDNTAIPSLQGVKVPDENLTPQQRQHRLEQLAKLKKMNKFLFPENDEAEFHAASSNQLAHLPPSDVNGLPVSVNMLLNQAPSGPNEAFRNTLEKPNENSSLENSSNLARDHSFIQSDMQSGGGTTKKINSSNMAMTKTRGETDEQTNSVVDSTADTVASFNLDNCLPPEVENIRNTLSPNMGQEEWAKFQNNALHCDFKSKAADAPANGNNRCISPGRTDYAMQAKSTTVLNLNNRSSGGPQPNYHQGQRSASVPISTQSPKHLNVNADTPISSQSSRVQFSSLTPPTERATSSGGINLINNLGPNPANSLSNDYKSSSPHKIKGPYTNDNSDNTCMDTKYTNFGLNYSMCGMPSSGIGQQNIRHNMQQFPSQFFRRTDNIPLNPNMSRMNQNKPSSGFDPISSLAQMSQQLTGCGMGLNSIGGADHVMDHCNTNHIPMLGPAGTHGNGVNQFNQSDINSMLCSNQHSTNGGRHCVSGNFNPNVLGGVGCNDIMPGIRSRRMAPSNFDNFNMSPNVHVKMNAPNTIQYMPTRSQNMANMRMSPNMEFFSRYSNNHMMGPSDMTSANMMNMFGNCNQQPPTNIRGFEPPNDIEVNLMPSDDYSNANVR
ncbi:protein BCL9 homolog [Haematobia irritans]|uniref:protein BCL9 homolog n=1 Tax=Haematobia irritans TaxID=7368 RepID=UPI003F500207